MLRQQTKAEVKGYTLTPLISSRGYMKERAY